MAGSLDGCSRLERGELPFAKRDEPIEQLLLFGDDFRQRDEGALFLDRRDGDAQAAEVLDLEVFLGGRDC